MLKKNLSYLSILFSIIVIVWVNHNFSFWKDKKKVIEWDVISYYSYLPAFFVYHDLELKFHTYKEEDKYIMWPTTLPSGKKVIKTTMGLSFLYMPFFLIAHLYSILTGLPPTGYTSIYKYVLIWGTIFYLLIGLLVLRKILINYFSEQTTAIILLSLPLGTNIYFFSTMHPLMPHVYLFTLVNLFVFLTIKWYFNPSVKLSIPLGILYGLISLIRPTDAIVIILFLLYNIKSIKDIKQRFYFLITHSKYVAIIIFFAFLIILPQLLYWKKITGHFLFYSYGDEGFFWTHPHILDGLFSYRKGWLVYTPIMVFAILGFPFLNKYNLKKFLLPFSIFFILNIYIIFSWWCWWYGGSFGQRALIDSYGILAIPMGAFTEFVLKKLKKVKIFYLIILLFFISLNLFNTYQYKRGVLHHDGTTKELYWKYFGKYKVERNEEYWKLVDGPDYEKAKKGEYEE